jgi:L-amino acid N-acyltransferase YncA
MLIRLAQPTDAAGIAKVHTDSWRTTYHTIVPAEHLAKLDCAQREKKWFDALSTTSNQYIYVAEDISQGIVGFVSGGPEREINSSYSGELYAIYLLASHQRQGIGTLLTTALVQRLIDQKLHSMRVWVLSENPSRFFYEKLGGKPAGEKKVQIGGTDLLEIAYGWNDTQLLLELANNR